jgi:hypothetical protein
MDNNIHNDIDIFTKYVLTTFKKDIISIDLKPDNLRKLSHYNYFCRIKKTNDLVLVGVLDLINFPNLKEIDCSNNKITKIINIPYIKSLICSANYIFELDYLPDTLEYLDCSSNILLVNLENLPSSIKYLNCSNCNIKNLNCLPYDLKILKCQFNLNCYIYYLPNKLQTLKCDSILELKQIPDSLNDIYIVDTKSNYEKTQKQLNENFKKIKNFYYRRIL